MGKTNQKTEHTGPKKGRGAYHGGRQEAKQRSNSKRRHNDKKAAGDDQN
jgi:hypothetical protein